MKKLLLILHKYRIPLLVGIAGLCLVLSFFELSSHHRHVMKLVQLEKVLHKKQRAIERVAQNALQQEAHQWLSEKGVESDMVVYKYVNDSLISWVNTFPIINDGYSTEALYPNFNFFSRNRAMQKPLAEANETEQYLNLGSAWYVVKVYQQGNVAILTGILIQTDFPFSNAFINSKVNPDLKLPSTSSIVPLNLDEGFVVFGKDKGVLFTILSNVTPPKISANVVLRWIALLLGFLTAALYFITHRNTRCAVCLLIGLAILRISCFVFAPFLQINATFFSPLLYAGSFLENSFPSLLLNTLYVGFSVGIVFAVRDQWAAYGKWIRYVFVAAGLFVLYLIHHTLTSLIANSNIVMELYKLDEINGYTLMAYAAVALLFLSLYQIILLVGKPKRYLLLVFLLCASFYSILVVSISGQAKEFNRDKVWTQKMAVERDLEVEMQMRRVEARIASDPILSIMIQMGEEPDLIISRIKENYFSEFLQRYQIQITICAPGDFLMVGGSSARVPCYQYFHSDLLRHGTPLANESHFYHLENAFGNISYLGVFTYYSYGGSQDLYIELDSHYVKDALGYPNLLSDKSQLDRFKLPYDFSYAKYIDGGLVSNSGKFAYPGKLPIDPTDGFSHRRTDGMLQFLYKTENKVLVISRPIRSPLPYLISFSYMFLFYGFFLSVGMSLFRKRDQKVVLPKNTFRRKITWLMVGSLVIVLVFMAFGSLGFGLKLYDNTNYQQMQNQMQAAQASLEEYIRYADRSANPVNNMVELITTMNRLASNVQIQINLYDPTGRLMRSSQPEIFEQYLLGARMNSTAFREMTENGSAPYTQIETIGNLKFFSMYAPLYNTVGALVAYINVPYISGQTDVTKDITSLVAAIINLYLLLLLAAILMSFTISNQMTRPLKELGEKMGRLDVTQKVEHIQYKYDDELGVLVNAFNKMADDLDDSTRRLAQSEREQAWREMARQIAHEIKNPLTPMRLSIQHLMRLKQENSPKWITRFDKVSASLLEQIDILSEAASEFSNFSRFYMEDPTRVEWNALIKEQLVLFNTSDHIKLHFQSDVNPAIVLGRRTQLVRLLVNLLSNAIQAVEELSIGVITLTLTQEGDFYLLQVADNGPGVAPENRDKLFKPNFTTKSSGTGLGLAICRGILEQSQGEIFYTSSEWGGACFNVRIPKAD